MQKANLSYRVVLLNLLKITSVVLIVWIGMYYMFERIYLNVSISEPKGYYFAFKSNNFLRGERVLLCVDDVKSIITMHELKLPYEDNRCKLRTPYLLKRVAAVSGDIIDIEEDGVWINGVFQINSRQLHEYKGTNLNPIAKKRYQLKKNEYFMLGETPNSYDSRYFGIVNQSQIRYKVMLLCKK